jgi:hypothetical protein
MAQSHSQSNIMAQHQKEMEQQALELRAGTDKVLQVQMGIIRQAEQQAAECRAAMEAKHRAALEKQQEDDIRVNTLLKRLVDLEIALKQERIRSLEFEAALAKELQHKRRATQSPEGAINRSNQGTKFNSCSRKQAQRRDSSSGSEARMRRHGHSAEQFGSASQQQVHCPPANLCKSTSDTHREVNRQGLSSATGGSAKSTHESRKRTPLSISKACRPTSRTP